MKTLSFASVVALLFLSGAMVSCDKLSSEKTEIIASDWISPNWQSGSFYSINGYYYEWNIEALTKEILDKGVILVYFKNWNNEVFQLPMVAEDGIQALDYTAHVGKIFLWYYWLQGTPNQPPHSSSQFRYVLIPSQSAERPVNNTRDLKAYLAEHGVDIHNYRQVCAFYGLTP